MSQRTPAAPLSFDDEAAQMAERMLIKSDGGMPESRRQAEGGFTEEAGGTLIDAGAKGATTEKSQKVGRAITDEPGRDKGTQYTGTAITDEPGRQDGGGAGEGGNLDTDADDQTRKRKPGQVGVSGGTKAKSNLSDSGDSATRSRKSGQVGIHKSDEDDEDGKPWKKGCMKKGDDEEDEEEEDEGDEAEKGGIDADDLVKSLKTLEAVAEGGAAPATRDRRAELAEGFALGTLNKSELAELHDLTKSDPEPELEEEPAEQFAKSYQETFAADPTMAEGYDVSPFLERQSQLLAASLDDMRERLVKSLDGNQENTRTFNRALAKSLRGMAELSRSQNELIKSLTERLEVVENQPMPRRGHSSLRTLHKSMPGEAGAGEGALSKAQIFDALETMAKSADYAPCGIKLADSVALFESSGQIPASLMRDVEQHIRNRGNGVR